MIYDAIIVGGGPAGLSGFLTRDGILPMELRRIGREQLIPYGVEVRETAVADAAREGDRFMITLGDGERLCSRMLLLATGVVDRLPPVEGIPDQPLAVYGRGYSGARLSLSLKTWSDDVILCTDGPTRLKPRDCGRLAHRSIRVYDSRIARLEGTDGTLERIVFRNGESVSRRRMFFTTGQYQRPALAARLGCSLNQKGTVRTNRLQGTGIPGLYVEGDATYDVQLAVVAAAEGAKAAFAINTALQEEEMRA